jgi:hypothetical protein
MPQFKQVQEIGNGFHLGGTLWQRGIHEGVIHHLEAMDNLVFSRGRRDSAVGMLELHRVRDDLALGVTLDWLEAGIRVQGRSNVEAFLVAKIPQAPGGRLTMDEYMTPSRTKLGAALENFLLEK